MDDHALHVELFGSGGNPILVLPGGGVRDPAYLGDLSVWGSTRPLAVAHFRGTPSNPGTPKPWWDHFVELERVRERLGLEHLDVLAHSAGTRVALAYAAAGGPVSRLGLICPPASWLTGTQDDIATLAAGRRKEPAIRAALSALPFVLTDAEAFRGQQRLTAPLGYARWDDAAKIHAETGTTNFAALQAFFGSAPPPALVRAIASLATPVHVIGGAEDLLSGIRPVRDLAALFRRGSLTMIEHAGHYPWIDQPAAFRAVIAEWTSRPSPEPAPPDTVRADITRPESQRRDRSA